MSLLFDSIRTEDSTKFLQFINTGEWLTTEQILSSSLDHQQAPGKLKRSTQAQPKNVTDYRQNFY